MNRLHPQDLRAEFAMRFYELSALAQDDEEATRAQTIGWSVASADLLLDELERTTKAELEPVRVPGALVTDGPEKPNPWPPKPDPDRYYLGRAEGAREERERIIGIIARSSLGTRWSEMGTAQIRAELEPKP